MRCSHLQNNWLFALASVALLICLVLQLGACPCGCLEHNAWIQMLGWSMEDHAHSHDVDDLHAQVSDGSQDHDCTGELRPQYINNARPVRIAGTNDTVLEYGCTTGAVGAAPLAERRARAPGIATVRWRPHGLSLAILQVYRI